MSEGASTKLKALSFQPIVYTDADFQFSDGYTKKSLLPLLLALPQIVAVVEAAEWLDHMFWGAPSCPYCGMSPKAHEKKLEDAADCSVTKAHAALAALREAL